MRILHIESGRHLYGGARQVADHVGGLDSLGIENVLIAAEGSELAAIPLRAERVEVPMAGDLDWRSTARLAREISRSGPDLVHVHSRRGADLFGGWAATRCGVPALVTRRVDSAEPAAWIRFKYRPYVAIAAISRSIERDLVERVGIERSRVMRIPSGVDTARFRPDRQARPRLLEALGRGGPGPLVGIVAQLIERKGHGPLLEAWAQVIEHWPDARLLVFGRGALEASLKRRVEALGLGANVCFAGFRSDMDTLLPGLDLLVHPAQREGLGLAVLEAMSAGVPVVASAAGGVVDIITNDADGVLVAPGDARALTNAMIGLLEDPDRRSRIGRLARTRIIEGFSVAAMSRAYAQLYEGLTDREPAAAAAAGPREQAP